MRGKTITSPDDSEGTGIFELEGDIVGDRGGGEDGNMAKKEGMRMPQTMIMTHHNPKALTDPS